MLQKNANPKSNHGKGKPAPSGAFTHRIREDGEVFSSEEGRDASSDTTPLASVAGSVRMRSTDSDRSVRATPKKARDASPPPQDDLWVVVKNLSQQFAAQQTELATLSNAFALQQKTIADLEKINRDLEKVLSNMASQMTSTSEANQTALAAILARLEAGPVAPQVVLVERQPEFRKAGAAAWLALKRETSVPAHSAPKVELSSGLRIIYASGFPYAKPGDLRKAMQGARIRTSAVRDIRWISRQVVQLLVDADYVSAFTRIITSLDATIVKSFKAWVPRSEAADKDKLAAISSFAAKTVTTIQRSPDVKARNFFRSLLASIGGKTLEAATAEAAKIRVQTPGFDISTMEIIPKESLPVKKATDKEPAAPAVDSPSDMAAGVNPAIQVDGATPTVTPIADVEMSPRAPKQENPLAYSAKLPTSPSRPASTNSPTSTTITADPRSQCCQYQQQTTCYPPYRQEHQALGHLRDLYHFLKISLYCPGSMSSSIQPRDLDAEELPSVFHRALVAMNMVVQLAPMILAKVPKLHSRMSVDSRICLCRTFWGHHQLPVAEQAFASIRQALDRVVPFDNNHPVLIFGDWKHRPTAPSAHRPLVGSWSDCHCSSLDHRSPDSAQSMVDVIRQSTTLCVMHQPAHCSPRHVWTDRQQWPTTLSFAHPFEQKLKDNPLLLVLQPYPAITVSKPLIGLLHPITWDVLADGASDDTDTDTDIHQLTSQFLESANAVR
ncbi:hypothetical protein BASA81_016075 [Batrachochytrium salamandrivorans]|nr:hypothetical protein BASA81_016075 [Batrachochytrium salamandrivorans]